MLLCRLFNRHFLPENVVQFRAIKDIYILSIVINSILPFFVPSLSAYNSLEHLLLCLTLRIFFVIFSLLQ